MMVLTTASEPVDGIASVAFKTEFAVDMTCQSCVDSVRSSLKPLRGIEDVQVELENKRVVVTGTTPPSILRRALKSTGRQVLVRGSGTASGTHEGAAVAILEAAARPGDAETQQVYGIARMVQVAIGDPPTRPLMLLDLTMRFKRPWADAYDVYVSTTGDVRDPPHTTGKRHMTLLKTLKPDEEGYADAFAELPIALWDVVGRAMVVEPQSQLAQTTAKAKPSLLTTFAGVIARSAGAWGNEKTVCACSGKTMWEEARENAW